ncbi:aldo/keto reductase [Mycolicibacterium sp. 018/SC-01/001]|nr:aldo/keto reductase [Mycolicibacterium sp. 018/SC-01/001]
MSEFYGAADWDESVAVIRRALDIGVTLLDTAAMYGEGHNEVLVGRAVAGRRHEVQIATKFGVDRSDGAGSQRLRGRSGYVQWSCESSLLRLGVDVIDLYYMHRPPGDCEIEETVGAMAALVEQGKVRHLGLCQVSAAELRRAHAVHPIAAVQSEYSLWTRDPEADVVPAMSELGVGLVPYAPLGRGYLTGSVHPSELTAGDYRSTNPRFADDANRAVADAVVSLAEARGVPPAQVALAWVAQRSDLLGIPVVPIPGTKRVAWLEQNAAATDIRLSASEITQLDALADRVVGSRV